MEDKEHIDDETTTESKPGGEQAIAEVGESQKETPMKVKKRTSALSLVSLLFAFLIPPLGLILSMVARVKAKNTNSSTKVATAAIAISTILFAALVAFASYIIYTNYTKKLDSQDNAKSSQPNQQQSQQVYTDDQKKAIEISEAFLGNIKSENYAAAYKLLSQDLQKEYINGESDFTKEVTTANLKLIDSWSITEVTTNGKEDRTTVKGKVNFRGQTPGGSFEFAFYKDQDGTKKMYLWQISPNT